MNQVAEFFVKLFDSSDWPPRWHCGQWTAFHGWLYIISDLLIWSAYFSIPIFILRFISKKQDVRFVRLYFLFAAFILACGATHLLDAIAFWVPLYRLNALVRFITGVISWVTVFYLIKYLPVLFSLKPQNALEEEIQLRKRSEEKFRGLLEAAPDAMVIANEKGEIILINRQTEKLFGYSKEELIGKQVEILIPVDFRNKHVSHRTQYIEAPKVRSMGAGLELFAVRKDGTQFPVEISLSPLITEEGTLISASVRDITGRKKLEEKFRGLLEAAPDAMVIANEKGEITLINRQTEKLFGYSKEELIGKPVEILIPSDFHNKHVNDRTRYFADPKVRSMGAGLELFAVRKDGTQFPVEISLSPLVTEEGTLISASVRDITGRKKLEEKFKGLLEAAPDAMVIANEKGEITLINRQTEKLFGYGKDELIGKQVEILIPVDFRNKHVSHRTQYIEAPKVRSMGAGLELFAVRKDGTQFPVEISLSPLVTEEGTLISASVRDITERKKAEDALSKLNEELEQKVVERTEAVVKTMEEKNIILESIGDAFFAVDKNWTVTYWNRVAETALAVPKKEILGNNLWEIFPDSIDSISYKKYHQSMETSEVLHFEDYYAALNKWYEISAYPSENGLSVYFKDVTERKKAAEEIAKLNLELEERVVLRTEQLKKSVEEMEAFSYSVSHDLRAPLRGIIGFANILEEDYTSKLGDEAKRITAVIKKNTSKMGQLIDDLLTFSRIGRQDILKANIDTNKMIGDIIAGNDINANSKKIKWIIHSLPNSKADINTLQQVWINLISNAVKYSGNIAQPKIEIGSIKENGSVNFFVKDNGVGFDEKYKAKLFKVFQRLHSAEEFEGTGIGLAIVDKIIDKHGGKVWAEGELNKGATFYFSLPVDKDQITNED